MMKMDTKKIVLVMLLIFGINITASSQSRKQKKANKDTKEWKYEVECVGIGVQGTYLVKVWSYSKSPKMAVEQAKKNAVHGIIFKGFSGNSNGCRTQKALAKNSNSQQENNSFFESFFAEGGKYMKYVSLSTDGAIRAQDRLKVNKRLYKIGVIVSVRKDELRKDLEDAGIVKKLTSGF